MDIINLIFTPRNRQYCCHRYVDWCSLSVSAASQTVIKQIRNQLLDRQLSLQATLRPALTHISSGYSHWFGCNPSMSPEQALGLLGPDKTNPHARKYAVFTLNQLRDDELELYLLELVQALRYEDFESVKDGLHADLMEFYEQSSPLNDDHLSLDNDIKKSNSCPDLEHFSGILPNTQESLWFAERCNSISNLLGTTHSFNVSASSASSATTSHLRVIQAISTGMDLTTFLVNRCRNCFRLSNYFYWYLMAECESDHNDINVQEMYLIVLKRFLMKLEHSPSEFHRSTFETVTRQYQFIQLLTQTVSEIKDLPGSRQRKLQGLKERLVLANHEFGDCSLARFDDIPMPLEPDVKVDGIIPAKTVIFKSATLPCKFVFRQTSSGPTPSPASEDENSNLISSPVYSIIFKVGNDLRQDQFAQQMILLFNRIFLDCGLDLKITPYKILATSANSGLVEYVESKSIAEINSKYGSIRKYFFELANKTSLRQIVGNFVKSCAAYCVMTYVLAVGDRHLDNLLISRDGCLFHVDFAFMLGQDPKPLPPPMKLTKEMIEAMGGSRSAGYQQFRQLCHTSYLVLRRNSNLILSLFTLMSGSSIPALRSGESPWRQQTTNNSNNIAQSKQLLKDRLKLTVSDRDAVKHIDHVLHLSSSALVATMVERLHSFAQAMRT